MIPEIGLIHMNGRVYDPLLGKFLSADPNVQFEKDVRSYNRYSYVANNPLRYTDPTGYFLDRLEKWVRKHALTVLNVVAWFYPALQPYVQALNVMTVAYYANNAQQAAGGLAALLLGGWAGDKAVGLLSEGASKFMQAVVRGGTTGAITGGANAMLMGTKIGRGILQGAAVGAVTAAIAWKVKQSTAENVTDNPEGEALFFSDQNVGDIAGEGAPISDDKPDFERAIDKQISNVRLLRRAFNDENGLLGDSKYSGQDLGGFVFEGRKFFMDHIGNYSLDKVNVRAAQGLITEPGLFDDGTALHILEENAAALVIGVRPSVTNTQIMSPYGMKSFTTLSSNLNAPVFVVSNRSTVYRFDSSGMSLYRQ